MPTIIQATLYSPNGYPQFTEATSKQDKAIAMINLLKGMAGGSYPAQLGIATTDAVGVQATGTIQCAGVDAADHCTINGVRFTAVANTAAVGANQFRIGAAGAGQDAACAVNLAAAINASLTANIDNKLYATVSTDTVTIHARVPGTGGNAYTLATSSVGELIISGATLANGTGSYTILEY